MKIIKLQSWEEKVKKLIENIQAIKFKWFSSAHFYNTYNNIIYLRSPTIHAYLVFVAYSIEGNPWLTARIIFTVLATFLVIQELVKILPFIFSILIRIKFSLEIYRGYTYKGLQRSPILQYYLLSHVLLQVHYVPMKIPLPKHPQIKHKPPCKQPSGPCYLGLNALLPDSQSPSTKWVFLSSKKITHPCAPHEECHHGQ